MKLTPPPNAWKHSEYEYMLTFIEVNFFLCRFLHVVGDGITMAHTETGSPGAIADVAHPTPRGHCSLSRRRPSKA